MHRLISFHQLQRLWSECYGLEGSSVVTRIWKVRYPKRLVGAGLALDREQIRVKSGMQGTTAGVVSLLHHTIASRTELDHLRGSKLLKLRVSKGSVSNTVLLFSPWMFLPHRDFVHHEGLVAYSLYLAHQICRFFLIWYYNFIVMMWSSHGITMWSPSAQPGASSPNGGRFRVFRASVLSSLRMLNIGRLYINLMKHSSSWRFGWVVIAID
jgi:hypothetical protein